MFSFRPAFFLIISLAFTVPGMSCQELNSTNTTSTNDSDVKACFMRGGFTPPKDVVVNKTVQCVPGKEAFEGVPNVMFNNFTYCDYDFQLSPNLSSVGFALEYFTPSQYGGNMMMVLESIEAIYAATNAGLRSYGPAQKLNVGKIKGPHFYLAFHIAVGQKNMTLAAHKLKKVLKNCYRCQNGEKEKVIAIAKNLSVEIPQDN